MSFFARYKKIFFALIFLLFAFLIGYFIWRLFFLPTPIISPANPNATGSANGLPEIGLGTGTSSQGTGGPGTLPGEIGGTGPGIGGADANQPSARAVGGLTKTQLLTDAVVLNPTLAADGRVQYYNENDGHFYKIGADGKATLLSDKVFHQVTSVTWAPSKDKAILQYPDGGKILYDFTTQKQYTLPSYWQNFSFSPGSDQIIAKSLALDPENRWLVVANPDGSSAKNLEPIGTEDKTVYPAWSPNNQIVALYTQGVDFNRQEAFFVGLNGENFKSTILEGRGLQSQWSTTGDRLLYSVYNSSDNFNPRLWIVDANANTIGQNRRSLDLSTWADKCTFASNSVVYCAVPENLQQGAGLFPELENQTKDNLYKIDLTTGAKQLIAVPNGTYNISQVIVPGNQDYLYFTDGTNGQLYKVQLK